MRWADAELRRQRLQLASLICGICADLALARIRGSDAVFTDSDETARGGGSGVRKKKSASILDASPPPLLLNRPWRRLPTQNLRRWACLVLDPAGVREESAAMLHNL